MIKKRIYYTVNMTKKMIDDYKFNTCGFKFDYSYLDLPNIFTQKLIRLTLKNQPW